MNYNEFYTSILSCAGAKPNAEGYLQLDCGGELIPLTIEKKPVALPTRELIANPSDDVVLFHPTSESLIRKESPVARQLRKLLLLRVNDISSKVITSIIEFAVNTDGHKKATPDQRDFLSLVPEIKPKTVAGILSVLETIDGKMANRIVSQTVRSGVKLNGVEYKRVSTITFPLLKSISLEDKKWNGVKFSVKDLRIAQDIAEYLFPDYVVKDEYSVGTHELQVPNLHCMMSGLLPIYNELNRIIAIFDLPDEWLFDTTYEAGLSKLAKYKALIPSQPGNEGDPMDGEEDVTPPVTAELPGHQRSNLASAAKSAATSDANVNPTVSGPVPAGLPSGPKEVDMNEAPWMRSEREKREAAEAINNPDIPGSLSAAERSKLSWADRSTYDKWYAEQIAIRQHELAMAAHNAQAWNTPQANYGTPQGYGGYTAAAAPPPPPSQYGYGGYNNAPPPPPGYGGHRPMSKREAYEQEQARMQQYSSVPMGRGRQVRY